MGLRLADVDTGRLSVRDLLVIVRRSPLSSALNRARRGDAADFKSSEYLLSSVLNTLKIMSWQLGGDPDAKHPELYFPPGITNPNSELGDAMTIDEMDQRLAPYYTR